MSTFWIIAFSLLGLSVIVGLGLVAYDNHLGAKGKRDAQRRSAQILIEQRIDRENRAFLAGHDSGIYGDFVPIDPETGEPIQTSRPERVRLTSDAFKKRHGKRAPGEGLIGPVV